ncbi:MAG: CDGSH iron-sulfur domain-containing protein [Proteobacteria bacterium]|nr:CDGSH iron-sulfur domain-containing protein [Pseudomonadota bacterium]
MKGLLHALAGVLGFVLVTTFMTSTVVSGLMAGPETIAMIKGLIFKSMFVQLPLLAGAGATGMSLLGKRTAPLGLTKQLRGPRAFMTSLLLLVPASGFLWYRASAGVFDPLYYGVQSIELAGQAFCFVMIGLNIRDGLALRGRIRKAGTKGPQISERDGGPLVVADIPALKAADGSELQNKSVMALCRCGQSKNKPFCDGSHAIVGFDSTAATDESKDEILTYEGEEVTIHYNRLLCSHAAECGRRQKAAFDSSRKPWIVPDNATAEGLREVVTACPSGALRFSRTGEAPEHLQADAKGITVERNGPYRVAGIPLEGARHAQGANPEKYVLCRCGASTNKPFCDGSHVDIGWKDSAGPA